MALFCLGSVRQQIFSRNNFAKAISQLGMISASQTERGMSSNFLDHYAKVPSLPAPNLQQTLSTYLKTVKPHVNDEEFAATESHAEQFAQGIGEKLHRMLQQKAANESNWLTNWWLDVAYLTYRLPVVVHSSPGLVFPKQKFESLDDQLSYAAKLIVGSLKYKTLIDGAKLPQDFLGKAPLDMSQYTKIFNGCRPPAAQRDNIRQNSAAKHVVVVHNNQFFRLDFGNSIPHSQQVLQVLRELVDNSAVADAPVGILTTEHRDTWAAVYPKLLEDPVNQASVKEIEDCVFLMCLDGENKVEGLSERSAMASQVLHGSGPGNNSGNRWFDKTLQLIVGKDGTNGLCYEHSPAEGPPMANLADFIVAFAAKEEVATQESSEACTAERLPFHLTEDLSGHIRTACDNMQSLVADTDVESFTFTGFGKEDIKILRFSPDSFIQVAIQMAFIRLHGHPAAHYESGSTRKFAFGRTDTIRSCLPEVVHLADAHLNDKLANPAKYAALKSAIQAHKEYVQLAIDGQAIDRHLLGMKLIAIENCIEVPSLYKDASYSKANNWRVSTSQVSARADMVMCFGPVVGNGYGCCYNPRAHEINMAVTAFHSDGTTSAHKMRLALQSSLTDLYTIAASNVASKL